MNLAQDTILSFMGTPVLRVSTALIERNSEYYGDCSFIETCIFSDIKGVGFRQHFPKCHRTDFEYARKFHRRLVRFMRRQWEALFD